MNGRAEGRGRGGREQARQRVRSLCAKFARRVARCQSVSQAAETGKMGGAAETEILLALMNLKPRKKRRGEEARNEKKEADAGRAASMACMQCKCSQVIHASHVVVLDTEAERTSRGFQKKAKRSEWREHRLDSGAETPNYNT